MIPFKTTLVSKESHRDGWSRWETHHMSNAMRVLFEKSYLPVVHSHIHPFSKELIDLKKNKITYFMAITVTTIYIDGVKNKQIIN
jgi:hypothetical protein